MKAKVKKFHRLHPENVMIVILDSEEQAWTFTLKVGQEVKIEPHEENGCRAKSLTIAKDFDFKKKGIL